MKNIAIIGSGNIGGNLARLFDTGPLTNARYLEPLAAQGIQLAYGKGHGAEVGFTFSPVK